MDTGIRMAELLCCAPETITTLLIGYTPIQNKKLKKESWENDIYLPIAQTRNLKDGKS